MIYLLYFIVYCFSERCLFPFSMIAGTLGNNLVRGVCRLEPESREARVKVLGGWVGQLVVLASSRVVLVAASVLPNLVTNMMADMVANLMASVLASVMALRIGWISSEHMARLDWGHMGTVGIAITLAVDSTLAMSMGRSLAIAMAEPLAGVLVVDGRRVDGGGRLHVLGQCCRCR